jgi:hypothetical protein
MTIDSRYEPEIRQRDKEVEYQFTFESIGGSRREGVPCP